MCLSGVSLHGLSRMPGPDFVAIQSVVLKRIGAHVFWALPTGCVDCQFIFFWIRCPIICREFSILFRVCFVVPHFAFQGSLFLRISDDGLPIRPFPIETLFYRFGLAYCATRVKSIAGLVRFMESVKRHLFLTSGTALSHTRRRRICLSHDALLLLIGQRPARVDSTDGLRYFSLACKGKPSLPR